jgi:AcrR family transcriptional regulator
MTKNKVGRSQRINRELILQCARTILAERGSDAITIRKIAEITPCAPPSIYYYFKNKESIVTALIEEPLEELIFLLKDKEGIQQFLNAYVEFWSTRKDELNLLLLPSIGTSQSMLLHDKYHEIERLFASMIGSLDVAEMKLDAINGLLLKSLAKDLVEESMVNFVEPMIERLV